MTRAILCPLLAPLPPSERATVDGNDVGLPVGSRLEGTMIRFLSRIQSKAKSADCPQRERSGEDNCTAE